MIVGDVRQAFLASAQRGAVGDDYILGREMVEQRRQPFLEQRQPVLHSREAAAIADRLI